MTSTAEKLGHSYEELEALRAQWVAVAAKVAAHDVSKAPAC